MTILENNRRRKIALAEYREQQALGAAKKEAFAAIGELLVNPKIKIKLEGDKAEIEKVRKAIANIPGINAEISDKPIE